MTVQFFARLRELAGADACELDLPDGATVADVWHAAALRFPAIAPFAGAVSSAVNADFARQDVRVKPGDDVAFLPPVSGGARVSPR